MTNLTPLKTYFIQNEGWKDTTYLDTKKIKTIGVGFNLERKDARELIRNLGVDYDLLIQKKTTLRPDQIISLLNTCIDAAVKDAQSLIPNLYFLDDARQMVLIDMVANMGKAKMSGFKKVLAAVNNGILADPDEKQGYWDTAAAEMKNSRWYKQVGHRGKRNVEAMKTGVMAKFNLGPEGQAALIYLN